MTLGEVINTQAHTIVVVTNPESPFGGVQVLGVTNIPAQIILREGEPGAPGPPGPPGAPATDLPDSGATDRGVQSLVIGQSYIDVTLPVAQPDTDYLITECLIINNVDVTPLNIWPGIITSKTLSGFRVQLNGLPDTGNYILHWAISGFVPVAFPATSYALTGPSTGPISAPSTFTVALPPGGTVDTPVIVTPDDGGAGGTFSPTTVTLTTTNSSRTFTYTPASYGAKTISVTSDSSLTDPAPVTFTSLSGTYTLTGPSSGATGAPSTNFTVALPVGGAVIGTVTVTPHATGGGTFTPATVALTTAAPSATFTYTPGTDGTKAISVTNNGGLTNPANISYVASTAFSPASIAGLKAWFKADSMALADGTAITVWNDSSSHAYNLDGPGGGGTFKTNIINSKPVVRFGGVSALYSTVDIGVSQPDTLFVVMKDAGTFPIHFLQSQSPIQTMGMDSLGRLTLFAGSGFIAASLVSSAAFHVYTGIFSGGNATGYVDGVLQVGPAAVGTNPLGAAFGLMTDLTSTGYIGDIAEVLIYNSALGTTDRQNVENYLKDKYGL